MEISILRDYFRKKYGVTGIDHANDLLKAIEKMPVDKLSLPLISLKSDLADIVMLGSETRTSNRSAS